MTTSPSDVARIQALEAEISRLTNVLKSRETFVHPSDAQIEAMGRRLAHNMTGDGYLFQSSARLIDFVRELLTDEPHVDGYPIMSGLPNSPEAI